MRLIVSTTFSWVDGGMHGDKEKSENSNVEKIENSPGSTNSTGLFSHFVINLNNTKVIDQNSEVVKKLRKFSLLSLVFIIVGATRNSRSVRDTTAIMKLEEKFEIYERIIQKLTFSLTAAVVSFFLNCWINERSRDALRCAGERTRRHQTTIITSLVLN